MSSGQDQILRIEEKLVKLLTQHQALLRENQKLIHQQEQLLESQKVLKAKVDELELQLALMKSSETEESKNSKAVLEKKINAYVKEIDKCIAILGNQA